MNRVGREGRGESVWVGWFLDATAAGASPTLCRARGDAERARPLPAHAERLRRALEEHAWDGEWYRRAYFDDGTPLGSARERRVPDRLDRAVLGGDLRRRRPASARAQAMAVGRRAPRPARRTG